jgi:hypothetical protein
MNPSEEAPRVISFPIEPMGDDGDDSLTCIGCGLPKCEWMVTIDVPYTGKITWTAIHERCRKKVTDKRQLQHDQAMAALRASADRIADQRDDAVAGLERLKRRIASVLHADMQKAIHGAPGALERALAAVETAKEALKPFAEYADGADAEGWNPKEWANKVILDMARKARGAFRLIEKP